MKRWTRAAFAAALSATLLLSGCGGAGGVQEAEESAEVVEEETSESAQDPLSFSDAKTTELSVTLDGQPLSV